MERTIGEVGGAGGRQRVLRDANVVGPLNGEEAEMGMTSHQDDFDGGVFERELGFLRDNGDLLCDFAPRQRSSARSPRRTRPR